ncbi:hypothetical protein ES332_D03G101400v1 [Gossypium tomentosum]|uniref:Uncharacterized protein n=1 Tax=Gossypium tomentosum TaxID=34277 RepID=A0A5D2LMV7_GOSTO|nr:hypothetical protein ES332_D03G101400v1 [Gossypium tomentosum]
MYFNIFSLSSKSPSSSLFNTRFLYPLTILFLSSVLWGSFRVIIPFIHTYFCCWFCNIKAGKKGAFFSPLMGGEMGFQLAADSFIQIRCYKKDDISQQIYAL